jgi:hypothetical protein
MNFNSFFILFFFFFFKGLIIDSLISITSDEQSLLVYFILPSGSNQSLLPWPRQRISISMALPALMPLARTRPSFKNGMYSSIHNLVRNVLQYLQSGWV